MGMISAFASSSNSSVVSFKKYDVFLSFRGVDTRTNFTSHLHEALMQKNVETYIDYRLNRGDEISPALFKAIKDSRVSIVILSMNYASSKWCLEELREIMECKKDQGQIVLPLFYKVDPSHVRKQTGSYKEAFAKHEGQPNYDKWKAALIEVANLAGWDSQGRIESELVKEIVRDVLTVLEKLSPRYLKQLEVLVGIEDRCEQIESLLKIGPGEVRTIGIWGMSGIGKTTLAKALYAKLSREFDDSYFLENISRHGQLEALQSKPFFKLLENKNCCFDAPSLVSGFDMHRLDRKKVLIVLDDVDAPLQLDSIINDCGFLGPGSRIVVTTRNKKIFLEVVKVYEVKKLSFHHSLQLFCLTAFGEKQPKDGYKELSISAISYCKGTPLALKVLGANLRQSSKQAWESELRKLQQIPNPEIHNVLKLSYDGLLDSSQRNIFLDIACFFKGEARDLVTSLLDPCFAESGIEVLLNKALITISKFNKIEMHDLIQEMGQEIVQKSNNDTGRRSRLWKPEEVKEVLKYNKGTDVVEGIILDLDTLTEDLILRSDSLAKMTKVRFLKISRGKRHMWWSNEGFNVYFPNGLESLSYKLRYFHWEGFCLKSLPSNFCAEQLVELRMPHSNLTKLWDGIQNLANLKKINLWDSKHLIEIPDLSKAKKLESVWLNDCESLRELHASMSSLPNLTVLSVTKCRGIESLNVNSKSLQILYVRGCSSLKEFSGTSKEMTRLSLFATSIRATFSSIRRKLVPLLELPPSPTQLHLNGCSKLVSLPELLPSLRELHLDDCSKLVSLPELPPSLIKLYLNGCSKLVSLSELPPSLIDLHSNDCSKLVFLPELPPSLTMLYLDGCRKLVSLPELPPLLEKVSAQNCTSLDTDSTQRLVLQHMLQNPIHNQFCRGYFIFPGDHVTDECGFCTAGSSITIPYLPLPPSSHLCGFIYCVILPKGFCCDINHYVMCSIYKDGKEVGWDINSAISKKLISEHVSFSYVTMSHVCSDDLPFKLEFYCRDMVGDKHHQESIKEFVVFPVYASESGLKLFDSSSKEIFESESITQISDDESHPRGIGVEVSNNENENEWEQLLNVIKSSVFF